MGAGRSNFTRALPLLALLVPAAASGQAGPPTKDAPSHPCAWSPTTGRNARCATPGEIVTFVVRVENPRGTTERFGVTDAAPSPAGCFDFICDPSLFVNGVPVALPAGTTCDPASGFDVPPVDVPGTGVLEVRFQATLSATLGAGDTCANLATIHYPWADVPAMEPMADCRTDVSGAYPTILTICGGSTGTPSFEAVKTAETVAGAPLSDLEDDALVCYRFRVANTGSAVGTVTFVDEFDAHFSGLFIDAADPFALGICGVSRNQLLCIDMTLGPGVSDEGRACALFTCTNGMIETCNVASLYVMDPPTGQIVSSKPCASCPVGETCLPVRAPDFASSTKSAILLDANRNGCLDAGDGVALEIVAANSGTDEAADVAFVDVDPPDGTYAGDCTWSVGGGAFQPCPASPASGWSLGAMGPADAPVVIRWSVTVPGAPPPGQWCDQGGSLVAPECDASKFFADACLPTCSNAPDLQGTKTCDPSAVHPGEEVLVTIDACNEGTAPATRVVISDPDPGCSEYVPGSLALGLAGDPSAPLTDAADGDGGTAIAPFDPITFEVADFLGRALQPGECVHATFRLVATSCPGSGFVNVAFLSADAMTTRNTSGCLVDVLRDVPNLAVWKSATPDPVVGPGNVVTYTLRTCNSPAGTGDATGVVVTDDVPACLAYEPGTLRADGRLLTDASDGDGAELSAGAPDSVIFRAPRLAPGECVDFSWQARPGAACGGTLVTNRASFVADGGIGPLSSNETATAIATYTLQKTASDVDLGRLVAGDEIEYAIEYCNGSPLDLLQVDVTDLVPSLGGSPASDCPVTYVAESMTVQVAGGPVQALTDRILDDLAHFEPGPPAMVEVIVSPLRAATCFVVRFRVRLDPACVPGQCVRNFAHAQYTTPLAEMDSNVATACTGAPLDGQLMRAVGLSSLIPTGGCELGQRLLEFPCSEIPGLCREDVPGTSWTMLHDGERRGEDVTFYELPGAACCAASPSDDATLHVRKPLGTGQVIVEIVTGCN